MRWLSWSAVAAVCAVAAPTCGLGQVDLRAQLGAMAAEPAVARAHWGVMVMGLDGRPIYGLNEGQLFQPASNAKLFTTAAAMALLGPETTFATKVVAEGELGRDGVLRGDLKLVGGGDANFGGTNLPYLPPSQRPKAAPKTGLIADIETLADQVVAKGLRSVQGDVVGDDTALSWEPVPPDWAADDLLWGYGAPVSALTVHDNQIEVSVAPHPGGQQATVSLEPAVPYYAVKNDVFTADFGHTCGEQLDFDRTAGARVLTVTGGIPSGAAPCVEEIAIDDPAEYGAMALRAALERRGVRISGTTRAQHWEPGQLGGFLPKERSDDFSLQQAFQSPHPKPFACTVPGGAGSSALPQTVLATHVSAPLAEDLILTNKVSQNLHAELFLRHLGASYSTGCQATARESLRVVQQWLLHAGLDREDFVLYDGSGLSGHDLVTPRATAKLLQYAARQPWFAEWKKSLPVGGVDGSLEVRFAKAPLKGHVFAKTGTLGEARALSGYLECASGRTVIFSIMVGNHAPGTSADREVMDRMVAAIAAAN